MITFGGDPAMMKGPYNETVNHDNECTPHQRPRHSGEEFIRHNFGAKHPRMLIHDSVSFFVVSISISAQAQCLDNLFMNGDMGTFLSGFVLLSHFGVRSIFIGCGLLLLALALLAFVISRGDVKKTAAIAAVGLLTAFVGSQSREQLAKTSSSRRSHFITASKFLKSAHHPTSNVF